MARRLAAITGESLTEAVLASLRERLARQEPGQKRVKLGTELARLAAKLDGLPVLDSRSPDEILGYDANGLPS